MSRSSSPWAILALACVASACSAAPPQPPASPTARPWPPAADLETIRELIESRAPTRFSSIGLGNGTVDVGLRSDAADIAMQLVDAYGGRVTVTVGFFAYPSAAQAPDPCPLYGTFADHPSLRATVEIANPRIPRGGTFDPTVRIANIGSASIALDTSSDLPVYLFLRGGRRSVGASDVATAGTGLETRIEPGMARTILGVGGTASCDLAFGYTLPSGPYEARALVDFARGLEGGNGPLVFWSDPLDVEIVPAS